MQGGATEPLSLHSAQHTWNHSMPPTATSSLHITDEALVQCLGPAKPRTHARSPLTVSVVQLAGDIERRSRQIFYLERNCEQR